MGLFDSFDENMVAVLNPHDVWKHKEGFPNTVIVTFKKKILEALIQSFETEIIAVMNGGMDIPIYMFNYKGKDIALYHSTIGGPATVALMEEVIAMGANKFVVFGSCGTLDANIPPGRVIVPTQAYRDEGTSYHYVAASDYIEVESSDMTAKIFDEINIPYFKTKVWTTDALYRETKKNAEKRRSEGCMVVDMECASVMALARFRKVKVYQYLYGEDTLDGDRWDKRTMDNVPQSDNIRYLQLAIEIAKKI